MGNITKKIISFGVALSIAITSLNAGLLSDIGDSLDSSIEVTDGGYFKTQTGGVWSAGSVRVRFDTGGTVYPFHAQAPSFSMGCNGIDIAYGAFSYLNFDYLVDKLKKVAAVAPAFAFQTAMRTLCPQCATILDNLEKISNAINGLNFDTCKMAQGLGSKISDTLLGSGASDNFMNARAEQINNGYDKIKDALKGVQKFFGSEGKKGAANMMGYGSFLKKAMETYKNPTSLSDEQWEAFVTALIGDVYGYTNKQKSTDGKDQTQFINFVSAEPIAGADTILKALAKGNVKIEAHIYKDNKDGEVYLKPTLDPIDVSFDDTNALIPYIQKKITDMIDKIKEHKSLSAEEIKFINSMPLPIYKIVNLESLENDASTSNLVAEYMGYDLAGKYLTYYVRHIKREINSLTSDPDFKATIDKTAFDKWSKKVNPIIKDLNKNINIRLQTLSSKLKNKVKILAYYQNLQKQLMQTNPIWKTGSLGM